MSGECARASVQGQIHALISSHFIPLPSPFHISPLHQLFADGIPKPKGLAGAKLADEGRQENVPYWPAETGNLPAPASGSEIKAVFEMSQKTLLLPHILHLWALAALTLLVQDTRKRSLFLCERSRFTEDSHVFTVSYHLKPMYGPLLLKNSPWLHHTTLRPLGEMGKREHVSVSLLSAILMTNMLWLRPSLHELLPDETRGNHLGTIPSWG